MMTVFSFFKKKDQDTPDSPEPLPTRAGLPTAAPGPATDAPLFSNSDNDLNGIEVSNHDSDLSAAEEQAVILHANKASQDAVAVLQGEMQQIRGLRRPDPWLMLFELYQQTHNRPAFEALGMEFVLEFEKTPPMWQERSRSPRAEAQTTGNACVFGSRLTVETARRDVERFQAAAAKVGPLQLDFSKVQDIDSATCVELLAIWQLTKRLAASKQLLGTPTFSKLLSSKIQTGRNQPAEAPFWLLLMELYQSLGDMEAFENLAIEYAITFEVSPPSWDPRMAPKAAVEKSPAPAAPPQPASAAGLVLHGEISATQSQGLTEIRNFIEQQAGPLVIDFLYVDRVDFESAGQLLNLLMAAAQAGKTVRLLQVNELVLGLLHIMGITELASVERRAT